MTKSRFRLIAFQAITPLHVDDATKARVRNMQKKTFGKGWLYFGAGYTLEDAAGYYNIEDEPAPFHGYRLTVNSSIEDYDRMLYDRDELCISVNAIVGANGSGKSSTVDMILRVLNNLAVAAMGETYNSPAAEHLYYIEDVYGTLVFKEGGYFYQIAVAGRSVKIGRYEFCQDEDSYICQNALELLSDKSKSNRFEPIQQRSFAMMQLQGLFYTAIFNYSLYAFNYNDYYNERTLEDRWHRHKADESNEGRFYNGKFTQERVWLNGLFHKNDGYQTPIVLNPMRENGLINTNVENKLAAERILGKLFYENNTIEGHNGQPSFPFRYVNEHLEIVALKVGLIQNPKYSRENVLATLGFKSETKIYRRFDEVRQAIVTIWSSLMQMPYIEETEEERHAWDYVFYKTLKICKTYKHYSKITRAAIYGQTFNLDKLATDLRQFLKDESHVTLKLRRALYFLKYDLYSKRTDGMIMLSDVYEEYHRWIEFYKSFNFRIEGGKLLAHVPEGWSNDEIPRIEINLDGRLVLHIPKSREKPLPLFILDEENGHLHIKTPDHEEVILPPIFDIQMLLIEKNKIEADGTFDYRELIPFEGLSSGEKQLIYSISNITYQITNINSVGDNSNNIIIKIKEDDDQIENEVPLVRYKYINAILDEVELYFHPDLQRRYVKGLLDAISNLQLSNIDGISLLMITHSPFILSDIPHTNILCLDQNADVVRKKTFSANIHEMLGDAFFMDSTIGEFAQQKLMEFIGLYHGSHDEVRKSAFLKFEKTFRGLKDIIADEYLSGEISDMFDEMEAEYRNAL